MSDIIFKPATAKQAMEATAWACAEEKSFEIVAGGTKRGLGRPVRAGATLDLSGLSGVDFYEPAELILCAKAGTPLSEIERMVDEKDQMLGFEPADYGPIGGGQAGGQTIGGVIACNISGPRRLKAGAARDHFLGFTAVNGRGESFKSGGRVMKNVTGYDMCKLMAGSHGTLGVLTDAIVKILPKPEKTRTVLTFGCDAKGAVAAMTQALHSPFDVTGAAFWPAGTPAKSKVAHVRSAGSSVTGIRLEGPAPSVAFACTELRKTLRRFGESEELHSANSVAFWRETRDLAPLSVKGAVGGGHVGQIWRLSTPPTALPGVVETMTCGLAAANAGDCAYFADWGGGLIWLSVERDEPDVAQAVRTAIRPPMAASDGGGHATLIRGSRSVRDGAEVFHPLPPAIAAITANIKNGFDPKRIFNPGRMYAGI